MKGKVKQIISICLMSSIFFANSCYIKAAESQYKWNEETSGFLFIQDDIESISNINSEQQETNNVDNEQQWTNYELDENGDIIWNTNPDGKEQAEKPFIISNDDSSIIMPSVETSVFSANEARISGTASDSITHGISIEGTHVAEIGMYASWAYGGATGSTPYLGYKAPIINISDPKAACVVEHTESGYIGANLSYATYRIFVTYDGKSVDRYTFLMTCSSTGSISKTYSNDNI